MAYYSGRLMKTDKYGKLFNGEKAPKDFQQPCKDHSEKKVKEGSCCKEGDRGRNK